MTEQVTIQDRIQAADEARQKGVPVDVWALLGEVYNTMINEITRLNDDLNELRGEQAHDKPVDEDVTTQDVMDVLATQETDE